MVGDVWGMERLFLLGGGTAFVLFFLRGGTAFGLFLVDQLRPPPAKPSGGMPSQPQQYGPYAKRGERPWPLESGALGVLGGRHVLPVGIRPRVDQQIVGPRPRNLAPERDPLNELG